MSSIVGDGGGRDAAPTYNKQGSVSSITYPSGRIVNYTFDASGRVATVQGTSGTTTTTYANGPGANNAITYWGNGAIQQVKLAGSGLSQSFSYNHRYGGAHLGGDGNVQRDRAGAVGG